MCIKMRNWAALSLKCPVETRSECGCYSNQNRYAVAAQRVYLMHSSRIYCMEKVHTAVPRDARLPSTAAEYKCTRATEMQLRGAQLLPAQEIFSCPSPTKLHT